MCPKNCPAPDEESHPSAGSTQALSREMRDSQKPRRAWQRGPNSSLRRSEPSLMPCRVPSLAAPGPGYGAARHSGGTRAGLWHPRCSGRTGRSSARSLPLPGASEVAPGAVLGFVGVCSCHEVPKRGWRGQAHIPALSPMPFGS